eukprot:COSAG06_NODE_511_length_14869_cov_115.791063_4_plen_127_part_00
MELYCTRVGSCDRNACTSSQSVGQRMRARRADRGSAEIGAWSLRRYSRINGGLDLSAEQMHVRVGAVPTGRGVVGCWCRWGCWFLLVLLREAVFRGCGEVRRSVFSFRFMFSSRPSPSTENSFLID